MMMMMLKSRMLHACNYSVRVFCVRHGVYIYNELFGKLKCLLEMSGCLAVCMSAALFACILQM